ncbi:MAG: uroporphyrinogen decarboxylase family protein [Phycisphaerae bacterium]|nr:uroporphyrinogen decarboxylase family protein [Phycisphaerae bacterium]
MNTNNLTGLEKWNLLVSGQDAPKMVSPLCDDWSLDVPYYWPFEGADPCPPGHRLHGIGQQIAMAGACGYDPTFLCGVPFPARRAEANPRVTTTAIDGGTEVTTVYDTPYGELKSIVQKKTSLHEVKPFFETEDDYRRMAWVIRQQIDYDEDAAVAAGLEQKKIFGQHGPMGTWWNPPCQIAFSEQGIYHLADWPDAVAECVAAHRELGTKQIATLRKAGFDYLFYCVSSTEMISPAFFEKYCAHDVEETLAQWRGLGGWILWHSCGRISAFIERGYYNRYKPEVFETMSEPPVGDLPSLAWGRQRLDRAIVTKGNVPLNIMLYGTPQDVRNDVARIRQQTQGYRHVVGLSDDILKNTPLANMRAFVDASRE